MHRIAPLTPSAVALAQVGPVCAALVSGGRCLDRDMTLADAGVRDRDTIFFRASLRGGMMIKVGRGAAHAVRSEVQAGPSPLSPAIRASTLARRSRR